MADRGRGIREMYERQHDGGDGLEEQLSRTLEDRLRSAEKEAYEKSVRAGRRRNAILVTGILLIVAGAGAFFIFGNRYARSAFQANLWFVLLSAALGAAVGTSELVSRYRDEPMKAIRSAPALTYIALNALVSACIYGLLTHYAKTLIPALAKDPLMRSITAGFGAMAILRSKFFTIRTAQGEEVGIGPDAAVSAFLSTADRGVDRMRAQRRLDLVFESANRMPRHENVKDYIKVALLSFQNLADRDKLNKDIEAIYNDGRSYPNLQLKLQAICYTILVVLGEYNFNKLINNLVALDERQDRKESTTEQIVNTLIQSGSAEPAATPPTTSAAERPPEPGRPPASRRKPPAAPISGSGAHSRSRRAPREAAPSSPANGESSAGRTGHSRPAVTANALGPANDP
jgi:hypothetical protein